MSHYLWTLNMEKTDLPIKSIMVQNVQHVSLILCDADRLATQFDEKAETDPTSRATGVRFQSIIHFRKGNFATNKTHRYAMTYGLL